MATIFDIAKEAKVSITTVSRALNGYSDVNEKTRQRIMAIVERLNYYPSAAARSLQNKKTNTIGFAPLVHNPEEPDPFLKDFIGMLALVSLKHDLSLLITLTSPDSNLSETYRELAGTGRVDGVILADVQQHDERVDLLQELHMPFVAFGRTSSYEQLLYPFVDVDSQAGIEAVVEHLYKQGHRRIAYFSDSPHISCMVYRHAGYQVALEKHAIMEDQHYVFDALQTEAEVQQAVAQLMEMPLAKQPTAIVASHDRIALTALNALKKLGRTIGQKAGDIAITGFDDLPFAAYLNPALTTLRQPISLACNTLLDVLVATLNKTELVRTGEGLDWLGSHQVLLEPKLIIRASA